MELHTSFSDQDARLGLALRRPAWHWGGAVEIQCSTEQCPQCGSTEMLSGKKGAIVYRC